MSLMGHSLSIIDKGETMNTEQHNQMVISNIDTKGGIDEEECPSCGKFASYRLFVSYHAGSVNTQYSLDCSHCGYHECDQDYGYCSVCQESEQGKMEGYEEAVNLDLIFECLLTKSRISGVDWSELKVYAYKNASCLNWYKQMFISDRDWSNNIKTMRDLIGYFENELVEEFS